MWKCSQSNFHFDDWLGRRGHKGRAYFHHRSRSPLKLYTREKRARTKISSAFFLLRRGTIFMCSLHFIFLHPAWWRNHEKFFFFVLYFLVDAFTAFMKVSLLRIRVWKSFSSLRRLWKALGWAGGWWRRGWHTRELFRLTLEQLGRKKTKLTVLNRFFGTRNDFYFTLPQITQIQMTARAGCCIIKHNIILSDFQLAGIVFVLCLLHRFHTAFHAPQLKYSINFPSALLALNFSSLPFFIAFLCSKGCEDKGLWLMALGASTPFEASQHFWRFNRV